MPNRRTFLLALSALALPSCTTQQVLQASRSALQHSSLEDAAVSVARSRAHSWVNNPTVLQQDLKQVKRFASRFITDIIRVWGEENARSSDTEHWVKYTDNYQSRGIINFRTGTVRVESLVPGQLKQAIISTLLSPDDPSGVDLFSSKPIKLGGEPFLYKQVLDQDGKPIRWNWRANHFAEYLLKTAKKSRRVTLRNGRTQTESWVEFPLVSNHSRRRQGKYGALVDKHSRKYQQEPALVYAIIETESNFNPFAVSWVPAYGLMQIVPRTAGRDSWKLIHGRSGTPSRNYLFNPSNNIRMGCAYLHILQSRYLAGVNHPLSLEYCMIAAYNGGAGNVLRCFSRDRTTAFRLINQSTPDQVYRRLRSKMPKESQHYLKKVTAAKKRYR